MPREALKVVTDLDVPHDSEPTHHGLKQTLHDISQVQRRMQRKMIDADKNLRALYRDMFLKHGGPGVKFTVQLEQPLRSLLLQIKRDILRTVKEERIILREFSISEGLPSKDIPEVLTRGVDVDSPNWQKKLQNPRFKSSAASVRNVALKTQAHLQSALQQLADAEAKRDALQLKVDTQEAEIKSLKDSSKNGLASARKLSSAESDYKALLAKHEKSLETFKSTHSEMSKTIKQYKDHTDKLTKQQKERLETITKLRSTKTKQKQLLDQQQKMITKLSEQVKSQDRDVHRMRKQLATAQQALKTQQSMHNEKMASLKLEAAKGIERAREIHESEVQQAVAEKEEILAQNFAAHSRALTQKFEKAQKAASVANTEKDKVAEQLDELSSRLQQESEEAQGLQMSIADLKQTINTHLSTNKEVQSQLHETEAKLNAAEDKGLKMRYEFENLRHFESALLQQQAAGEAAVSQAQKDAENATMLHRRALDRFEKELRSSEEAAKARERDLSAAFELKLTSAKRATGAEVASLQEQLQLANMQLEKAKLESQSLIAKVEDESSEALAAIRQQEAHARAETETEARKVQQLESSLETMRQVKQTAESKVDSQKQALQTLEQSVEVWKQRHAELKVQEQNALHEAEALRSVNSRESDALGVQNIAIQKQLDEAIAERDLALQEADAQRAKVSEAINDNKHEQETVHNLELELQRIQNESTKHQREAAAARELASDLATAHEELGQRGRDLELAKQRLARLERAHETIQAQHTEAQDLVEQKQAVIDSLRAARDQEHSAHIQQADAEIARLQSARASADAKVLSLSGELSNARSLLATARQDHANEVAALKAAVVGKRHEIELEHARLSRTYSHQREQNTQVLRALKQGITGLVQTLHASTSSAAAQSLLSARPSLLQAVEGGIESASEVIADAENVLIDAVQAGNSVTGATASREESLGDSTISTDAAGSEAYFRKLDTLVGSCVHRAASCLGVLAEAFRDFRVAETKSAADSQLRTQTQMSRLLQLKQTTRKYRGELSDLKATIKTELTSGRIHAMQAVQTLHRRHGIAAQNLRGHIRDAQDDKGAVETSLHEHRDRNNVLLQEVHDLRSELQHEVSEAKLQAATEDVHRATLAEERDDAEKALLLCKQKFEDDKLAILETWEERLKSARQDALQHEREREEAMQQLFSEREAALEKQWTAANIEKFRGLESDVHREKLARKKAEVEFSVLRDGEAAAILSAQTAAESQAKKELLAARNNYIRALARNQDESDEQLEAKEKSKQALEVQVHETNAQLAAESLQRHNLENLKALLQTEFALQSEQLEDATNKVSVLQSEHAQLDNIVAARQKQVSEYVELTSSLRANNSKLLNDIAVANSERDVAALELETVNQSSAASIEQWESELESALTRLRMIEQAESATSKSHEQIEQHLSDQNKRLLQATEELRHQLVNAESEKLRAIQENETLRLQQLSGETRRSQEEHEQDNALGLGKSAELSAEHVAECRAQIQQLREQLVARQDSAEELLRLQAVLAQQEQNNQDCEQKLVEAVGKREEVENTCKQLERECTSLSDRLAQADLDLAAVPSDEHSVRAESLNLQSKLDQATREVAAAEENIAVLESTLKKVKKNARKRIESLDNAHRKEVERLQQQLDAARRRNEQNAMQSPRASTFFQSAMGELVKSHKNQMDFASAAHTAALERAAVDHANRIQDVESRYESKIASATDDLKREKESAARLLDKLRAGLNAAKQEAEAEAEECSALRNTEASLKGRNRGLNAQLAKLEMEMDQAQDALREAKRASNRAQKQLAEAESARDLAQLEAKEALATVATFSQSLTASVSSPHTRSDISRGAVSTPMSSLPRPSTASADHEMALNMHPPVPNALAMNAAELNAKLGIGLSVEDLTSIYGSGGPSATRPTMTAASPDRRDPPDSPASAASQNHARLSHNLNVSGRSDDEHSPAVVERSKPASRSNSAATARGRTGGASGLEDEIESLRGMIESFMQETDR